MLSQSSMTYDDLDNLLTETDYLTASTWIVTSNSYDGSNLLGTVVTDQAGVTLSNSNQTLDESGNVLTVTNYLTASTFTVTNNVYDGSNLVGTTVTDQSGKVLSQSSMTYDDLDNLLTETDYLTASTWMRHQQQLRRLQSARDRGERSGRRHLPELNSTQTVDELGNVLTQTDYLTASTWMVTSNVYDGFNLVGTTVTDQSGKVLSQSSMTYDDLDNLLTETDYLTSSTWTVTNNVYDGSNRVGTTISDQTGAVLSHSTETVDEAGNPLTETDYLTASTYAVTNNTYVTVLQLDGYHRYRPERQRAPPIEHDVRRPGRNLLTETELSVVLKTWMVTINTYDGSNPLVGTTVTDQSSTVLSQQTFSYDDAGNDALPRPTPTAT